MTWTRLFRRKYWDRERSREIESYLQMETDENMARGLSPEEAKYAARRKLGNSALIREEIYIMNSIGFLETFWQDVRYAVRRLRQSPGFAFVCILTLALGIGANAAIFTLVDAVMLKSLPVVNPGRLWRLGDNNNCCVMGGATQNGGSWVLYSYPLYSELRDHTAEFTELAAFQPFPSDLSVRRSGALTAAEPYNGEFVSGNYFRMFGVSAIAGRALTGSDEQPGSPPVAVMNYHTWQTHFGGDPSVVGVTFTINTVPYTLVGVAPSGFYGEALRSDPPDFWLPLATEPLLNRPDSGLRNAELACLCLIGRLRAGARVVQAQSHLAGEPQQWLWQKGWESATPQQRSDLALADAARREIGRQHIHLTPAGSGVDGMPNECAAGLRLLMTIAAPVLLIACANIANLLFARGAADRVPTAV